MIYIMCVLKEKRKQRSYNMSIIKQYAEDLYIVCEHKQSRYGFNHIAKIFFKGRLVDVEKVRYINRTWEEYTYQTVLRRAEDWIDNNLKLEHFKKIA